jgi:iron(II)-dependent oxidoreductase
VARLLPRTTIALAALAALALGACSRDEPPAERTSPAAERTPRPAAEPAGEARPPAAMASIPGGRYPIGSRAGGGDERPVHTVRLQAFQIDRREVTHADYARFLNGLGLSPTGDAGPGRVGAADLPPEDVISVVEGRDGQERGTLIALDARHARIGIRDGRFSVSERWRDHPVTQVTWDGARAYCEARDARLPTEAEWEAAARGRGGRPYPWGAAPPTPRRAVFGRRPGRTLPVGERPAGATAQGVHDLAGNVEEWTSTLYAAYPYREGDGREDAGATAERVTRGGNHVDSGADELRSAYRKGHSREWDRGHRHIGFRCAR